MKASSKIIAIGLNKTGTSSLHQALTMLGFASVHFECEQGNIKTIIDNNHQTGRMLLAGIEHFDAYSDWNRPDTNHLFTVLDAQYPASKFILTTRDLESWLTSREKHVQRNRQRPDYDGAWLTAERDKWLAEWRTHHEQVRHHFNDRPGDLLELNIIAGDGWQKLCPFLDVPLPTKPFPHTNMAPSIVGKIKSKAAAVVRKLKSRYQRR